MMLCGGGEDQDQLGVQGLFSESSLSIHKRSWADFSMSHGGDKGGKENGVSGGRRPRLVQRTTQW